MEQDISKLKIEKTPAAFRTGRRKKLFYLLSAFLIIILGVFLYFEGIFVPAIPVEVTSVMQMYPSQAFTLLNASGFVVAQRKAAVASKVTGLLVSINVEEGSKVKKGQIIARLENEDMIAAKNQAEANLNVARHNLEQAKAELQEATLTFNRYKELLPYDYISRADYDAAEARYNRAVAAVEAAEASVKASKAALQAANVNIEYTLIRAPFDAVVLTKNADVGDIVTPIGAAAEAKAAVVTIADLSSLQVEVDVSESNLGYVKEGQPCEIQLDAIPESHFRGVVHMIVPTADRSKGTVMVKVRFLDTDPRILPEMSAKVSFLSRAVRKEEQRTRIVVNSDAIVSHNGKKVVFVVRDDRAFETSIVTGEKFGEMIEVLNGLKSGDKVVLKPAGKLRSGRRIKIVEK